MAKIDTGIAPNKPMLFFVEYNYSIKAYKRREGMQLHYLGAEFKTGYTIFSYQLHFLPTLHGHILPPTTTFEFPNCSSFMRP